MLHININMLGLGNLKPCIDISLLIKVNNLIHLFTLKHKNLCKQKFSKKHDSKKPVNNEPLYLRNQIKTT